MARRKLNQVASDFIQSSKWLSDSSNLYLVDYFFPSLGVLDLITAHMRANFTLTDADKKLLSEASSFLLEYVVRCWEECGLTCEIVYDENGSLVAIQGLESKPIHFQSIFSMFLANASSQVFIDRKIQIPLAPKGDIICSFIQGFLRGAYFEESAEVDNLFTIEFGESLDRVIARQYGKWHELLFPQVTLAHLPELYLYSLKSRHFLASDQPPLLKEVTAFVEYFKTLGIDPGMAGVKLGSLFLQSPSEYLSLLGVVLLAATDSNEAISDGALSNVKVRSYAVPLVRAAFYKYRELLGIGLDWATKDLLDVSDRLLIEREQMLGLTPWVILDPKYIVEEFNKSEALRSFFNLIKEGDFFESQRLLDTMLEENPADLMLRVQKAHYLYVTGEFESGHEYSKQLLSEPNIERSYLFFNTWGMILLAMKQIELAIRYLKLSYTAGSMPLFKKVEIGNNLAWCYLLSGENSLAEAILEEIRGNTSLEAVSVLLNHLFISEPADGLPDDLKKALQLAPMDKRVFNNLILNGRARIVAGELKI